MEKLLQVYGLEGSLACALVGLLVSILLIRGIAKASPGNEKMQEIANAIKEGARAYLNRQVLTISAIALLIFGLIFFFKKDLAVAAGFLVGAVCSLAAGYIGMTIAVMANTRTTEAARSNGPIPALRMAFNGGAVTGLLVVALALLSVGGFYWAASTYGGSEHAIKSLIGLALGSSLISVFARLGGGIYTKAADVGADLVGKLKYGFQEDDPRNPATIADNVGDNVGDCAGMAADVFETYAVSIIGALLIGSLTVAGNLSVLIYPFVLSGLALLASVVGIVFVNLQSGRPTQTLVMGVAVSSALAALLFWPATRALFPQGLTVAGRSVSTMQLYSTALIGLLMTGIVVWITNYYTSTAHGPVRKIARASETGSATNIIAGLAVGNHSTLFPVLAIVAAILASFQCAGLYGVAIAVVSMLSLSGIIIALDAFGPITDNAGGIAVMSELPAEVRHITDDLDAVGNTMKAVTKGYAIASAGLASLVLFGSYVEELRFHYTHHHNASALADGLTFSLNDPRVIVGMFIGGLLPFLFSGLTMESVGKAASAVVTEVKRQVGLKPGILDGSEKPEYSQCVDIVTKAALKEMIIPALLPLVFVLGVAAIPQLGAIALGGMLVGCIVTGLFVGISMTSSGGAWDNAKKYIEEGAHGGKGSEAHAAAVTGDTVGDPYKDTSGPAINPMIKVVNILAILVIPLFF